MKSFNPIRLMALALGLFLGGARAEEPKLDSHPEPLRPLLEKTWIIKNGGWSLGHEADYHVDPGAKVVFQ